MFALCVGMKFILAETYEHRELNSSAVLPESSSTESYMFKMYMRCATNIP